MIQLNEKLYLFQTKYFYIFYKKFEKKTYFCFYTDLYGFYTNKLNISSIYHNMMNVYYELFKIDIFF